MEVQEIFRLLRHRWRILVILTLLCMSVSLAWALAGPVEYRAQGRVMIATYGSLGTAVDAYSGERVAQLRAPTYAQLIEGSEVSTRAAHVLGGRFTPEMIQSSLDARISAAMPMLLVSATAPTPDDAVRMLAAVEQVFKQYVTQLEQPGRDGSLTGVNLTNDPPAVTRVGSPLQAALLAGLGGFAVGVVLALYRDRTDQVIRNAGQIARTGLPYRGAVVSQDGQLQNPDNVFRRVAVQCASDSRPGVSQKILVTGLDEFSDRVSSLVAGGLATGFAAYGRTVTSVCARPAAGDTAAVGASGSVPPGLSDLIAGDASWNDCIEAGPVKNLERVGIGSRSDDLAALIMKRSLGDGAAILPATSDHTVVDGPQLIVSPSAIALAAHVDSCLLVVTYKQSLLSDLVEAAHILQALSVPVIGVVAVTERRALFRATVGSTQPLSEADTAVDDGAAKAEAIVR
jgi:capsular polysaccharide biosynthesis protein